MIYRILLFATIISQVACGQTAFKNQSKPFLFVDSLFEKDEINVEILDFTFAPDIQDIILRFQKAMAENKEWAQEYFSKNYKESEGLPYNEKFGISKEEYEKIKDIEKSGPTITVKSSVPVKVNRTVNNITFTAARDEIKFIELLKIDLRNQIISFNNDTIPFNNEINAPASTPFGEWHGYAWKKETSNLGENDDLKIDKLISKIIEIDFGKVKSSGKSLLRIKYKDVDKGQVKANLDMAYYIN
jgi:hypothetical protein